MLLRQMTNSSSCCRSLSGSALKDCQELLEHTIVLCSLTIPLQTRATWIWTTFCCAILCAGGDLRCMHLMPIGQVRDLLMCVIVDFGVQEGTGITKLIPHLSPEGQDLLQKLLMYNPEDRISAKQALRHAFFREIR